MRPGRAYLAPNRGRGWTLVYMKEVVGPFACDSHESQNVMNHSVVAFCNRSILCDSSFLQVYLRIGRVYHFLFFPVYLEACGPLKSSLFLDMRHDVCRK